MTDPPSSTPPTTGTVAFMEGSITLGSSQLSAGGIATFNTAALSVGNHVVTAIYSGTVDFAASHSATGVTIITTVAGGGDPANRAAGYPTLSDPEAVVVDSSGNVFIADSNDNVVDEVSAATGAVTIVAGGGKGLTPPTPAQPGVYGVPGDIGDGKPATAATLNFPEGLAVERSGPDEELFIADTFDNEIRVVNLSTGVIQDYAGNYTESYLDLNPPFPSDSTPSPPDPFSWNGPTNPATPILATSALLYAPIGITFDSAGNLFIADSYNNLIREVFAGGSSSGMMITVAGNYNKGNGGYTAPAGDGKPTLATATLLDGPSGVAVDGRGDLFVADTYNNIIREVDTSGDISTYAGVPTTGGGDPGPGGGSGDGGLATMRSCTSPKESS